MRTLVRTAVAGAVFLALLPASPLRADTTPTAYTEYHERIKVAQTVQPLGETPFGESINQYKGGVSFNQLDINYTGQGPAIQFARGYDVGGGRITVDGQDVRQGTQASLRRAIGIGAQGTVLRATFRDSALA